MKKYPGRANASMKEKRRLQGNIILGISLVCLFQAWAQQGQKSAADTTKAKEAATAIPALEYAALPDSVIPDSTVHLLDSLKNISDVDEILENENYIIPTPEDTVGKIKLPVNVKKDQFAWFDAMQSIDRVVDNEAFQVGEKLTFTIRYGIIKAGSATMGIPDEVKVRGNKSYKIVTEARSSNFFSAFYKVRDRVESIMDKDGLFTWHFKKQLREGKYRAEQSVEYNQVAGWAVTNKKDSLRIPPCVQDILTSFYYIRTKNLEVGKSHYIDNHADNRLYPLEVKVHKKERVKVGAGEFNCIVVEPIIRASGLFKQKGRLLVWLSDDERKVPVQMKSKIIIGYITAELMKMEGVKKPNHAQL
ncbi:MAG: DUF3108 domain-containing protein [Candidatus Zhuqueibacterota bacterium]